VHRGRAAVGTVDTLCFLTRVSHAAERGRAPAGRLASEAALPTAATDSR
jgi:hypothetical protein